MASRWFLLLVSIFSVGTSSWSQDLPEWTDSYVKGLAPAKHFRGTVVAERNGQVLVEKSYGTAVEGWQIPDSPDTKFELVSLSKQFTAAAILQLVDNGKLRVEDPVSTYYPASPPDRPTQDYLIYVVCESADKIVLVRFGPGGARIEHQTRTGLMPMDINGPHGIAVSPDKQYFYVSVGHGRPEGSVWKYRTGSPKPKILLNIAQCAS